MAKKFNGEVIGGNNRSGNHNRQPGLSGIDFWEQSFPNVGNQYNAAEEILKFPDNTGAKLARGNFDKKPTIIALVRWKYKVKLFHDDPHDEMIDDFIQGSLGYKAAGKTIQLQAQTNLIAPELLREQLGLKKNQRGESVSKSSDFDNSNNNQQEVHKQ